MAGTKEGARKAAATNRARHGESFYANIGRKGGQNGHTGGFAANRELAKAAGAKGGRISPHGPAGGRTAAPALKNGSFPSGELPFFFYRINSLTFSTAAATS